MANSAISRIIMEGSEQATNEARADALKLASGENEDGPFDREVTWAGRNEGLKDLSAAHPGVAFVSSVVEPGNRRAEATVWHAGEIVGEYEMPDDEYDEINGGPDEECDETAVLDALASSVHAYAADALEADASAPRI
jgi:hypothetical protein